MFLIDLKSKDPDRKGLEGSEPNAGKWDQRGRVGPKDLFPFCMSLWLSGQYDQSRRLPVAAKNEFLLSLLSFFSILQLLMYQHFAFRDILLTCMVF